MKIYNLTYEQLKKIAMSSALQAHACIVDESSVEETLIEILEELNIEPNKPKETGRLTEL